MIQVVMCQMCQWLRISTSASDCLARPVVKDTAPMAKTTCQIMPFFLFFQEFHKIANEGLTQGKKN